MIQNLRKKLKKLLIDLMYKFLMRPAQYFKGRRLFDADELKNVHEALLSQDLFGIGGKFVTQLEQEYARAYEVSYAVASTSGTAAIHTALGAINLNPGDEVITAPITDLGTVIPIINQGAIPVFSDINEYYNMDPADVERKITSRTKAIIVVHLFGNPCDMDAMVSISKKHNVVLIEDCCQAHMTEYKGKFVGTFGDIGCFSFQQSKHMTTGDGGMTITNNKDYYDYMKLFVDKGFARKGWGPRAYRFHGQNYRMNELTAAVGLAQLKKVGNVIKTRNELGQYMTELLSDVKGIQTAPVTAGATHSYWLYPLYFEGNDLEQFAKDLMNERVRGTVGYTVKPIYLCSETLTSHKTYGQSQYPFSWKDVEKKYEYKEGLCPKAEDTLKHLFCINLNECWTKKKIEQTVEGIRKVCEQKKSGQTAVSEVKNPEDLSIKTEDAKNIKKVRIGIIGCGLMGGMHLMAYKKNPDVEIVAYCDTDIDQTKRLSLRVKANIYSSHKDMLANEKLDGVSVCTVPSTHKEIVCDTLDAGVNVLCEKPLAVSVQEAREMTDKANQKKKLLLTAFKFRFFEEVSRAKEILEKGQLGQVVQFRLMFGGQINMEGRWYVQKEISGGGIIMDNGPHAIDLVRYLLGEIQNVQANVSNFQDVPLEDTAQINCRLASGASGSIDISWTVPAPSDNYLEIYGKEGTMFLDFNGFSYKLKTWSDWRRIENQLDTKEAFAVQFDHFVQSIVQGPKITINDDGLKVQEVIESAYASLDNNTVKL